MRVLVVEDEQLLADALADGLKDAGWAVDVAYDGEDGLGKAQVSRYDVIVLDRDLPKMHGDDVCRVLAAEDGHPRILMLTAATAVPERVTGLGLGADDYLGKPFALAELMARLHALARRANPAPPPILRFADLELDPSRRTARRRNADLPLTRKEFSVLHLLMAANGSVLSAEDLLERAWDEHADPFTNAVRVTMATLRKKLGEPPLIQTVIGAGYRLDVPAGA